jgi:hypothetical protein
MTNGGGLPSWATTVGSLVAITIFGSVAGGIAGYERAQGVTEAQRLWFEQRLSAVHGQVEKEKTEIRSNLRDEWDSFEARVLRALERKVDLQTHAEQMIELRRRLDEVERQVYGRHGDVR